MQYNFERIKVLITSACNANCTHCFRRNEKNTSTISFDKIKEIVDFGIGNGCSLFSFSGGEFFTHPDAYNIIDCCINKDVHISILTNGLDINVGYFAQITNRSQIDFQVSVDGLKETHDLRRGKGAFDRTTANVAQLFDLGYKIAAKTVIDENNYKDIIAVFQMPWFSRVLVLPVAFSKQENNMHGVPQWYRDFESIVQLIYKKQAESLTTERRCQCYPIELAIKYDGNVYPCTEAREHNEFLIGNILNKSITDVLADYESNASKKFICPEAHNAVCDNCSANNVCNRGCRLRALRFHGDMSAPDPFNCRIFNNEYLDIPIGQLFWGEK